MNLIRDKSFGDVALSLGAVFGSAVSVAPGHCKDDNLVVVAGSEVADDCWAVVCHCLQLLYELKASRVFTLNGAQGVRSIRCDQGVPPLLKQRRSRNDGDDYFYDSDDFDEQNEDASDQSEDE